VFADLQELLIATPMREVAPWLGWVDTLTGLEGRTKRTFQAIDGLLERVIADHCARRAADSRRVEDDDDHQDFVDVLLDVKDMDKGKDTRLRLDIWTTSRPSSIHHGHVLRRHRHFLHVAGMGHGGAYQPPPRDA
jgi:hypothetical protein